MSDPFEGQWLPFDSDPITGKEVWIMFEGDKMRVRTIMPVDDMLDQNAAAQANSLNTRWGDGQQVARIPMHVWQRELAPAIQDEDDAYVRRWLNDADHARFRTRGGHV